MYRVFVGVDDCEMISYHVLADSIMRHASEPVAVIPIKLSNLAGLYLREHDSRQSNEFSFSRFLVPFLCNYYGTALFMDCDMLVRTDICELFKQASSRQGAWSVMCAKHDYTPKNTVKYLGNTQHSYPRKNWSSLMLFDCERCLELTPGAIKEQSAAWLHRMKWASSGIAELELEWNWLVGEYDYNPAAKILHWTVGGPWFEQYENCDYSDEWYVAMRRALNVRDRSKRIAEEAAC
jgi:hypothetical protein